MLIEIKINYANRVFKLKKKKKKIYIYIYIN